jgi:hypothetical protein
VDRRAMVNSYHKSPPSSKLSSRVGKGVAKSSPFSSAILGADDGNDAASGQTMAMTPGNDAWSLPYKHAEIQQVLGVNSSSSSSSSSFPNSHSSSLSRGTGGLPGDSDIAVDVNRRMGPLFRMAVARNV